MKIIIELITVYGEMAKYLIDIYYLMNLVYKMVEQSKALQGLDLKMINCHFQPYSSSCKAVQHSVIHNHENYKVVGVPYLYA